MKALYTNQAQCKQSMNDRANALNPNNKAYRNNHNHHANQLNPNNIAYKKNQDNRANQLNPNNDAYWKSRNSNKTTNRQKPTQGNKNRKTHENVYYQKAQKNKWRKAANIEREESQQMASSIKWWKIAATVISAVAYVIETR